MSLALGLAMLVGFGANAQQVAPSIASSVGVSSSKQASQQLTLGAALQAAIDNSPTLSAARREVDAAQGALTQAGVYQNPSLDLEVEDLRSGMRSTTVTLSQPLELGGKRSARVAAAERALEAIRVKSEATEAQLKADVTAAFLSALLSQERVRLAQESLNIARSGSQA